MNSYFPQGVKWLMIVNSSLFLLYFFAVRMGLGDLFSPFKLVPGMVVKLLFVWQLFTYMFLHDPWSLWHILFNMLSLWMFGSDLERIWGTRRFLQYYFLCGVGAGVCVVVANALFGDWNTPTIGASGAIFGLLLAFGVLFPDRTVLFSFLFPIKAKYFVMLMGAIAFLSTFGSTGSGVSHVAHLGGMLFGYGYIRSQRKGRPSTGRRRNLLVELREQYREWRFQRAKKKFQVYMRKQDRDRWTN
jgi:membrane associated rhomboid family serine protease